MKHILPINNIKYILSLNHTHLYTLTIVILFSVIISTFAAKEERKEAEKKIYNSAADRTAIAKLIAAAVHAAAARVTVARTTDPFFTTDPTVAFADLVACAADTFIDLAALPDNEFDVAYHAEAGRIAQSYRISANHAQDAANRATRSFYPVVAANFTARATAYNAAADNADSLASNLTTLTPIPDTLPDEYENNRIT